MSIILGIDPGSRITGFGVIEAKNNSRRYLTSGCIKTIGQNIAQKLHQIYTGLTAIIKDYQPDEIAIEKIFLRENVASAFKLGEARGAAFVAIANHTSSLSEYSPRVVKKTIVGYGGADKNQMQQMIKVLLCLSDIPQSDAADALAIALCHANHQFR